MEVPTKQEFDELKKEFDSLKAMMNQILVAKVTVEWVSIEVAESILGLSRSTIYKMRKSNTLDYRQRNRKVKVSLSSIRKYMREHAYEPAVVEARINSLLAA